MQLSARKPRVNLFPVHMEPYYSSHGTFQRLSERIGLGMLSHALVLQNTS